MGFSDITVLHFAFYTQANLITFYGPAALTQF
jgi:muramoyltetrapeptide carboxypeptidase LdcA involved in peptidoglycan recycling